MNQQEQAPILTTREAVEESIHALAYVHGTLMHAKGKQRVLSAARLLCDLYGFKLEQFLDVKGATEAKG